MLCAHCRTSERLRVPGQRLGAAADSRDALFCEGCGRSILNLGAGDRLMLKLSQLARFGLAEGHPLLELARRRS